MRQFIRHPSDIPIEYNLVDAAHRDKDHIKNISQGGLCFRARNYIQPGCVLGINIPIGEPMFQATGFVVWCRESNDYYDIGIKFKDATVEFSVRMVEQLCHIEQYKKDVFEKEGRRLSGEKAALEWIAKFAGNFPT
jgi:hypothetical protein